MKRATALLRLFALVVLTTTTLFSVMEIRDTGIDDSIMRLFVSFPIALALYFAVVLWLIIPRMQAETSVWAILFSAGIGVFIVGTALCPGVALIVWEGVNFFRAGNLARGIADSLGVVIFTIPLLALLATPILMALPVGGESEP